MTTVRDVPSSDNTGSGGFWDSEQYRTPRTPQIGPHEHTWQGSIVLNTIDFEFKRSRFRVEDRVGVGPIEVEIGDGDGLGVSVRVYGLRFMVYSLILILRVCINLLVDFGKLRK